MAEHEHDWLFAYAALAGDGTYTAHYDCRDCTTTRTMRALSHTEVTVLVRREQLHPAPVVWTEAEARHLCFWQAQVECAALGADDQAPADPPVPALAFFEQQLARLHAAF